MTGVADLGGSIITGIDGNPLAVLAAQLRIPLHHINSSDVPLFCDDGSQADRTLDSKVVRCTACSIALSCKLCGQAMTVNRSVDSHTVPDDFQCETHALVWSGQQGNSAGVDRSGTQQP